MYATASGLLNDVQRKMALVYMMGEPARTVYRTFIGAADLTYQQTVDAFTAYFTPFENLGFERHQLAGMVRRPSETLDHFNTRLTTQIALCGLGDERANEERKQKLIYASNDVRLQAHCLVHPDMTCAHILEFAQTRDATERQVRQIATAVRQDEGRDRTVLASIQNEHHARGRSHEDAKSDRRGGTDAHKFDHSRLRGANDENKKRCFQCDRAWPHEGACPASDKSCNKCKKKGHFQACCPEKNGRTRKHVRTVRNRDDVSSRSSSSSSSLRSRGPSRRSEIRRIITDGRETVRRVVYSLSSAGGSCLAPRVTVRIDGHEVTTTVDSGSMEDTIDEPTYRNIRDPPKLDREPHELFLYTSTTPLRTLGRCEVEIEANGRKCRTLLTVIKGEGGSLVSHWTARRLGLFQTADFLPVEPDLRVSVAGENEKLFREENHFNVFEVGRELRARPLNNAQNGRTVTSGRCEVPPSSPQHEDQDPFEDDLALAETSRPCLASVFTGMVGQDVSPRPRTSLNGKPSTESSTQADDAQEPTPDPPEYATNTSTTTHQYAIPTPTTRVVNRSCLSIF